MLLPISYHNYDYYTISLTNMVSMFDFHSCVSDDPSIRRVDHNILHTWIIIIQFRYIIFIPGVKQQRLIKRNG